MGGIKNHWRKEACVYQIYPASYADSNGDGIGDLKGIISKLDYIKSLGVDVIWVCPFFKCVIIFMEASKHQADKKYIYVAAEGDDVSDYKQVHEPYGTVADVDALIAGAHKRGIKVIADLVVNHTSHQHAWFEESRSSKDNPKRDWYIWRPAKYVNGVRTPPCNWRAAFLGSVWEWDEKTEEYYLHYFCPEQPDLNWENPDVRQAIYNDAIRFWMDRGLDGFRIDTVNMYSKFLDFPDVPVTEPETPWQRAIDKYFCNGPRLHEFLKEMHAETFSKYDAMTVGEAPSMHDFRDVLPLVSTDSKELDMVFEFGMKTLSDLDHGGKWNFMPREWKLSEAKAVHVNSQHLADPQYKAWVTNYIENHDIARAVTRYGSETPEHRVPSSKMLAMRLLTLSGTAFIYQGQEIGMINCPRDWSIEEEYRDVESLNLWKVMKEAGKTDPKLLKDGEYGLRTWARDHARTPMQWSDAPQAGWSTSDKPWMRVMDSYKEINVASQENDPESTLAFYRKMLKLRKEHRDLFIYGLFEICDMDNEQTMTYIKRQGKDEALVVLNFTEQKQPWKVPESLKGTPELLLSTFAGELSKDLRPFEGRIYLAR